MLAKQMENDATKAVELTDLYFLVELDYSGESLRRLEEQFEEVEYSMPGGATEENLDLLVRLWGAYVGEVFRRQCGGTWGRWKSERGDATALEGPRHTIFPHEKVRKRFVNGPEDSISAYFETLSDLW